MKYLNKFNEGSSKWNDYAIDDIKALFINLPIENQRLLELTGLKLRSVFDK